MHRVTEYPLAQNCRIPLNKPYLIFPDFQTFRPLVCCWLLVVTEERTCFCVHTVVPANTEKWTSYVINGELFVNTFPARCKNNSRKINTIASIWRKNIFVYLSLDIICCSKLSLFLELYSRKLFASPNRQFPNSNRNEKQCADIRAKLRLLFI